MNIVCDKCKTLVEESTVKEAQEFMKKLPASFDPQCPAEIVSLHPSFSKYYLELKLI